MNNLRLIPDHYRQQEIIKASFAYDKKLIAIIKTHKRNKLSIVYIYKLGYIKTDRTNIANIE